MEELNICDVEIEELYNIVRFAPYLTNVLNGLIRCEVNLLNNEDLRKLTKEIYAYLDKVHTEKVLAVGFFTNETREVIKSYTFEEVVNSLRNRVSYIIERDKKLEQDNLVKDLKALEINSITLEELQEITKDELSLSNTLEALVKGNLSLTNEKDIINFNRVVVEYIFNRVITPHDEDDHIYACMRTFDELEIIFNVKRSIHNRIDYINEQKI